MGLGLRQDPWAVRDQGRLLLPTVMEEAAAVGPIAMAEASWASKATHVLHARQPKSREGRPLPILATTTLPTVTKGREESDKRAASVQEIQLLATQKPQLNPTTSLTLLPMTMKPKSIEGGEGVHHCL
mmetsp:Transcript_16612/g.32949  ORF Transcript_16612/g.32949 Transcript_16612/m.32949 type:complete len:128 (+) Transcript_16612:179-562(+)